MRERYERLNSFLAVASASLAAYFATACTTPVGKSVDACVGGDAPEPVQLRLIAPLSTATVTSQTPTLHWLASGPTSVHVEVCSDRPCTQVEQALDATGNAGTLTTRLPAGVHFWRAKTSSSPTYTATWGFSVGRRNTPLDTSWGTTLDVNGDGYADVIVGAPAHYGTPGSAYVYLGSPLGLAANVATALVGPARPGGQFGLSVASAGDVNGDGYGDVIVGAPNATDTEGRVYIYLGSAAGLASTAATTLNGPDQVNPGFGASVASAGDLNGDGFADVLVGVSGTGATDGGQGNGSVRVYLGSVSGIASSPATILTGPGGGQENFGFPVASAGDVNGDGFADVVVGADQATDATGRVYMYLGSAAGLLPDAPSILAAPTTDVESFGNAVAVAGDVNADGYADLIVGANQMGALDGSQGNAFVYLGSAAGLVIAAATSLSAPGGPNMSFGSSVGGAGDVNGDGYADVVAGAMSGWSPGSGAACVYLGSATGVATAPASTLGGPAGAGGNFGVSVAGAGDVNQDGYADVVVGASGALQAYVYLGISSGLAGGVGTTLNSPVGPSGPEGANFGQSVASAIVRSATIPSTLASTPPCLL